MATTRDEVVQAVAAELRAALTGADAAEITRAATILVDQVLAENPEALEFPIQTLGPGIARNFIQAQPDDPFYARARGAFSQDIVSLREAATEPEPSPTTPTRPDQDTPQIEQDITNRDTVRAAQTGEADVEDDEIARMIAELGQTEMPPELIRALGFPPDDRFYRDVAQYARTAGLGDLGIDDIIRRMAIGDDQIWQAADRASFGHASEEVVVTLKNGQQVSVFRDEYEAALSVSGLNNLEVNTLIRLSAENGLRGDEWKYIALAAKDKGVLSRVSEAVDRATLPEGFQAGIPHNEEQQEAAENRTLNALAGSRLRAGTEAWGDERDQMAALTGQFNHWQRLYGRPELALVAMYDPALASSAFENGGLDAEGSEFVTDMLNRLDVSGDLRRMGITRDNKYWQALENPDGSTIPVELPDPVALEESYRELYRSWFRQEPSDLALMEFSSGIHDEIRGQARGLQQQHNIFKDGPIEDSGLLETINVNPNARARRAIRYSPLYQRLFAHKGGLSEEQYVSQFDQAAGNLGVESSNAQQAIMAGMETGSTATTEGQLVFSSAATTEAGIMNRLAAAARTIARYT